METPSFDLKGKVAIVTGGTKGLGLSMAEALAAAGADLVIVSRTKADCDKVAADFNAAGYRALSAPTDVSKPEQIQALIDAAVAEFGKIDILVNNAGVGINKPTVDLTVEEWDHVIGINLRGPFLMAQAVGRQLIKQGHGGKIINVASMLGMVGEEETLPYCASKGGCIQLTRGLAVEWARKNIQVNAVCPGYVITNINEDIIANEATSRYLMKKTPMRRYGKAVEIAGLVQFLASSASDYMTGAIIPVDGGWTAQ